MIKGTLYLYNGMMVKVMVRERDVKKMFLRGRGKKEKGLFLKKGVRKIRGFVKRIWSRIFK